MKRFVKYICIALALLCVLSLAACNGDEAKETEGGSENSAGVSFYMTYNNVKIELGADADKVIDALGEPQKKTENGNCGGLGTQYKYSYPSIDIYVLESTDGNAVIDQITFRDDLVSTSEGVSIGSTLAEAKKALGEPTSSTSSALLYTKGQYNLKLGIDGDLITEINYLTVSE